MPALALPPGPRTLRPGGEWRAFGKDPLGFLTALARAHGPVARFRIGPRTIVLLADPERVREVLVVHPDRFRKDRGLDAARTLLGDGLLTSHGETWRRHRRLAQPAFHPDRIAAAAEVMARRAVRRVSRWADGATLDAHEEGMALALEIVAEALFGAEVEGEVGVIRAALDDAVDAFRIARLPFAPLLDRLPLPSTRRLHRARATLDRIVLRMIAARRAAAGAAGASSGGDLLGLLLAARDPEGGPGLSDAELRDEAMTLFLAGHETTANALAWAIDLLGRNPEARARLEAEVDEVLGGAPGTGGSPARSLRGADAARLPYARQVVAEAMRLYPPAWTVARRALEPVDVGPWTIPAGATALMPQWVIHRDPALWPEPERFDPDRFLPERRARLPRLAYFPFGAGPRICIGEGFAWAEATLALAAIAQQVRLHVRSPAPPVPQPRITLRPEGGVPVTVERRAPPPG